MYEKKYRKAKLPDDLLSRSKCLSIKPDPICLYGKYIKILPLDLKRDAEPLFTVLNGSPINKPNKSFGKYDSNEMIWKHIIHGPFSNLEDFIRYYQKQNSLPNAQLFCIFDIVFDYQIGIIGYKNNYPEHLKIEGGFVILSPIYHGTKAFLEANYLLAAHIFKIGYRRMEIVHSKTNIQSHKILKRYSIICELIQKNYDVSKGRQRDLAINRILDFEWPEIKKKYEEALYGTRGKI